MWEKCDVLYIIINILWCFQLSLLLATIYWRSKNSYTESFEIRFMTIWLSLPLAAQYFFWKMEWKIKATATKLVRVVFSIFIGNKYCKKAQIDRNLKRGKENSGVSYTFDFFFFHFSNLKTNSFLIEWQSILKFNSFFRFFSFFSFFGNNFSLDFGSDAILPVHWVITWTQRFFLPFSIAS